MVDHSAMHTSIAYDNKTIPIIEAMSYFVSRHQPLTVDFGAIPAFLLLQSFINGYSFCYHTLVKLISLMRIIIASLCSLTLHTSRKSSFNFSLPCLF